MQDAKQDEHGCSSGQGSQLSGQRRSYEGANVNPPPTYPKPPMPNGPPPARGNEDKLIAALLAQTQAINRLAASNEMLVQAMAESGDMGEDVPPTQYLDGSPIR